MATSVRSTTFSGELSVGLVDSVRHPKVEEDSREASGRTTQARVRVVVPFPTFSKVGKRPHVERVFGEAFPTPTIPRTFPGEKTLG